MVITESRLLFGLIALGVIFLVQAKQRRVSDDYLKRLRERQHDEMESALARQERMEAEDAAANELDRWIKNPVATGPMTVEGTPVGRPDAAMEQMAAAQATALPPRESAGERSAGD